MNQKRDSGGGDKWQYEQYRALAERAHDKESDFMDRVNEAAMSNADQVLRTLVIINGGAAIAMLAFIGSLISADGAKFASKLPAVATPILWFVWGVAIATFAIGLAYLTNYCMATSTALKEHHYEKPFIRNTLGSKIWIWFGIGFQLLAILSAFVSLGCFIWGMTEIRDAIVMLFPPA